MTTTVEASESFHSLPRFLSQMYAQK